MPTLKEIVQNNNMANFSHYIDGSLYYAVTVEDKPYQFPVNIDNKADIGTAVFSARIKAITLMRYIRKALENGSFTLRG